MVEAPWKQTVSIVNYHLNMFLSASAYHPLSTLIFLQKELLMTAVLLWCTSSREAASKYSLTKLLNPNCTFLFQYLSSHVTGIWLFNHAPMWNLILGYFPISQSNHYNIMMASICRDKYCIRPFIYVRARIRIGQCNRITLGFSIGHWAKLIIRLTYMYFSFSISHFSLTPSLFSIMHLYSPQCLAFVTSICIDRPIVRKWNSNKYSFSPPFFPTLIIDRKRQTKHSLK